MIKVVAALLVLLSPAGPASAADGPPTDASLRKLLAVSDSRNVLEGTLGRMDTMMRNMTDQMLKDQPRTAEQQAMIDSMTAKFATVAREEMSWDKVEPIYLKIYRDSFSQSEVDGMLAFYATPAGQAVIRKMPLVAQNTISAMSELMGPMMKRMQQMAQETVEEVKAKQAGQGSTQ